MTPSVHRNNADPPGVVPKRSGAILMAVIVAIVVIASMFSGRTAKKLDQPLVNPPVGASTDQLKAFAESLSNDRSRMEAQARQFREQQLAEEKNKVMTPVAPPAYHAVPPPRAYEPPRVDPFEQSKREREERAPFASNIALSVASPAPPALPAPVVEKTSEKVDGPPTAKPAQIGSGRFLPEKEKYGELDLYRLYEGTVVETTLVNRLDGSFTGPVKCTVAREVRSKDGHAILIPTGSEFIGEARRVDAQDQRRLAVSFKRLLLPNGYSIDLGNDPGLSEAGATGLKDQTDNHYLRSFGISGAIGLLGGLALYGGQGSAAPYATGFANSVGGSATNVLNRFLNVLPTITIREGHPVKVYLSNDLQLPEYRP